jgi:dTDP-4-amino-4,6-dideoxygalactose transaminase
MIATNDDGIAEQARMLRVHGSRKKYYNEVVGYNSRLDTIQAAILRVKLPYVDAWNTARCEVAKRYNELLAGVEGIVTPEIAPGHVFHQYTVRITKGSRDAVQQKLATVGIGTMVYYPVPQDQLPLYKGLYEQYPVSDRLACEVLSLPIWPEFSTAKSNTVIEALLK